MLVICTANKGNNNPLILPINSEHQIDETNFVTSCEWYTLNSEISGYNITVGKKYTVIGIIMFKNEIRYLISDDNNIPGFFPSNLFRIMESYVLYEWEIRIFPIEADQRLVIGYSELTQNYNHLIGLIDNNPNDIKLFLNYINNF